MKYLLILLIPAFLLSCKSIKNEQVDQGVVGTVLWFEGNLMPSPGVPAPKGKPIERKIIICDLTNISDLGGNGPLFDAIGSNIVKEMSSDKEGVFSASLPVGKYSVFVKEDSQYFANSFDSKNNVGVLTIEENKVTTLNIQVNYKATY